MSRQHSSQNTMPVFHNANNAWTDGHVARNTTTRLKDIRIQFPVQVQKMCGVAWTSAKEQLKETNKAKASLLETGATK